ncbi:hypothetical protein BH09MYX1_BH09MYX1_15880 [soil metagenome]
MTPRELAEIDAKPIAALWITSATTALDDPASPLTRAALEWNFAFARLAPEAHAAHVAHIRTSYAKIRNVFARSHVLFADVTDREAVTRFGLAADNLPPAFSVGGDRMYFTSNFRRYDVVAKRGYGSKCRAAMVIHEAVHVFDRRSGEPEIHVSEWDPRFDDMTPEQQLHNASAYASFAAEVHHRVLEWGRDVRYGAGRPAE